MADEPDSFTVHKFRVLNKNFWRSLKHSSFYFPSPAQLNDPADCQIDLVKAFHLARVGKVANHSSRQEEAFLELMRGFQNLALTCGVYSFSAGKIDSDESRLFWAHYAANHTGVCLTFNIPNDFVSKQMIGCDKIDYSTDTLFSALRNVDLSQEPDFDAKIKPIITAYLTTKAPEWKYEDEARIVSNKPGPRYFDRSWLKQICFGLRTSDYHRERVNQLAKSYPDCSLVEAVRADDNLFRIALQEVDP
jgi:hypothetical protein